MSRGRPPFSDEVSATVISPPRELPGEEVPVFLMEVVDGPDRGAAIAIDPSQPSRAYVGKSPICQLVLRDPRVSRRHLALETSGSSLRLTDLGSTNGTEVNHVTVIDAVLHGGEIVQIGDTTLRVARAAPTTVHISSATSFGRAFGASPEMRRLYPLCERLAASEVPLVIEGETGTGKELLAESLHECSPRAGGPFVVFDCTAVPANLVEAALFGHERGAFTGAVAQAKGVFEQADGGTLFIDEIGDLDISLQPKLLRAIERSEVRRVGGDRWIKVNVRVMAATRRDLDKEIQAGRFRDDLFYRLAVARIELPPLRARQGDVAMLAQHFWKALGGGESMPYDLLLRFEQSDWPGNVRELHNAVARHLALGELAGMDSRWRGPQSTDQRAPVSAATAGAVVEDPIERVLAMELPLVRSRELLVDEFERRYVQRVLERHGGDATRAAQASGIARRYFQLLRARQAKQG